MPSILCKVAAVPPQAAFSALETPGHFALSWWLEGRGKVECCGLLTLRSNFRAQKWSVSRGGPKESLARLLSRHFPVLFSPSGVDSGCPALWPLKPFHPRCRCRPGFIRYPFPTCAPKTCSSVLLSILAELAAITGLCIVTGESHVH